MLLLAHRALPDYQAEQPPPACSASPSGSKNFTATQPQQPLDRRRRGVAGPRIVVTPLEPGRPPAPRMGFCNDASRIQDQRPPSIMGIGKQRA